MKSPRLLLAAVPLFAVALSHAAENDVNYRVVAESVIDVMHSNHYHPAELDGDHFRRIEEAVVELGETAASADDFLAGFNSLWQPGPFSHVRLLSAEQTAERNARRDSAPSVDDGAVTLAWEGATAILTVNSMSGTIERIEAAYDEIAARGAEKLIIDLRRNGGGAFGVLPLVRHLISEPIDAGVFVNNQWYEDHDAPPGPADFPSATPCQCTLESFLADMQSRPMTSYRIEPMQPRFEGPVFVLASAVSISAAEIAIDALKAAGRATVIGEKTFGILLQPRQFDLPGGFSLIWPIGDYLSIANGRIEGVGVAPDIAVDADRALEAALGM